MSSGARLRPTRARLRWRLAVTVLLATLLPAVPASATGPTVTLDQSSYVAGETVTVSVSGGSSGGNLVGIFRSGDATSKENLGTYHYTSGSSGTFGLTTDGLTAGTTYVVDVLGADNGTGWPMLASVSFTLSAQPRAVSFDKTAYTQGAAITASYSTGSPSQTNWIGIYPDTGPKPQVTGSWTWAYAPGSSGSVQLSTSNLTPGGYLAYYLYNDGYTKIGRPLHFYVTDGTTISTQVSPTFTLDKGTYTQSETVSATYTMPAAGVSSTNWVGIYPDTGSTPGVQGAWDWTYAPNGSGTVTLPTSNLTPGGYVAYYLYNGGYTNNFAGYYPAPVHFWIGSAPTGAAVPHLDHVFVVMMENQNTSDIFGTSNNAPNCSSPSSAPAPYLDQLACDNVTLTNSHGLVHLSDPNYVALESGSTYINNDPWPGVTGGGVGSITAPHLGTLLENIGKTWKVYQNGQDGNCDLQDHSPYYGDNSPFPYFSDMLSTTYCQNHVQPLTQLTSDLNATATTPNLVWFEPGICYSMHNCSVASGDSWMSSYLPTILTSKAFTQQKSLLVITWDEDRSLTPVNQVPTIIVGSPGLTKTRFATNHFYSHYNVLRTIEDGLGVTTHLTPNDTNAIPINNIWP